MTAVTAPAPSRSDRTLAGRAATPVGVLCLVASAALSLSTAHDTPERVTVLVVEVVAAAVLFGLVVPRGLRRESAGRTACVLGALGLLLLVPAFWSGLPLLLGAAAALLGFAGRRAARGSGPAIAGLVLGLLTVVGYAAIYAVDALAPG